MARSERTTAAEMRVLRGMGHTRNITKDASNCNSCGYTFFYSAAKCPACESYEVLTQRGL